MKQVVLIKQHSSVQLGHLYEHLYCTQLRALFFSKRLFECLDFSLSGATFDQGGLIEISIELYTPKAIALVDQLATQTVSLDRRSISLAFTQLLAEEERAINVSSYDAVVDALVKLDKQAWQDIDDFTMFKPRDVRLSRHPIHLAKDSRLHSRKITLNLVLNVDFATAHQELIPLFRQITQLLAYTMRYCIATNEGFYPDEITFITRRRKVYSKLTLLVADGNDEFVNIDELLRQYQGVFHSIKQTDALERLMLELHATSYRDNSWDAPNTHNTYKETGVYLGSKGWRVTATLENCNLLLASTTIEIAFGKQAATAPLGITS